MDGHLRRTRFHERIRVERLFLVPINKRFGVIAPLAGMTADAIDSWEMRALGKTHGPDVPAIAKLLKEAALRAELLADNSRDVFEARKNVGPDGIGEIAEMLGELLLMG